MEGIFLSRLDSTFFRIRHTLTCNMHLSPVASRAFWVTLSRGVVILNEAADYSQASFWMDGDTPCAATRMSSSEWSDFTGYFIDSYGDLVFVCKPEDYSGIALDDLYAVGTFNDWHFSCDWQFKHTRLNGEGVWVLKTKPSRCFPSNGEPAVFKLCTRSGIWLEPPSHFLNCRQDNHGNRNLLLWPEFTGRGAFFITPECESFDPFASHFIRVAGGNDAGFLIDSTYLLHRAKTDRLLGARVCNGITVFTLFAPRATSVTLWYRKDGNIDWTQVSLLRVESYAWEVIINEDLTQAEYYYTLDGAADFFNPNIRVLDPYARAAMGPGGPGIVIGPESFKNPAWNPPSWHDLVIVEAHVRDLIAKAPQSITDTRGLKGLAEWICQPDCYLRELGVNAVELQPLQQFDGEDPINYHWGYMPVNYFCVASHYASAPRESISEMKAAVQAFHDAGLAVIVDVVYNHIGEPNGLYAIDPDYYFEKNADGFFTNWSGCGNDLRCDSPMCRRLICESLAYWISAFDVDGFRFDLADLMGVPVLVEIERTLKAIKPSIVLIAEPWSFRGHSAKALQKTGFSSWNDGYRDFMARYVCGNAPSEGLVYFLKGSTDYLTDWPAQTVNYVESHDDFAWIDRITQNYEHDGSNPTSQDIRRTHMMISVLMMSLGIPMLSAGQDFLRSKKGVYNTYQRPDLNALDYERAIEFSSTVEYVRNWIRFRRSDSGSLLRCSGRPSRNYIRSYPSDQNAIAVLYNADHSHQANQLLFAINPHIHSVHIPCGNLKLDYFIQIADHERFIEKGLKNIKIHLDENIIQMPPLSCGLWIYTD
jgi:pullulanase